MNVGPGGFGHAPVSKGLVLATVGCSIISNAARASQRRLPPPLVLVSQSLAFRSPGELLFGCMLLYYYRVLERQAGSKKYGSYATVVTGMSYALQLAVSSVFQLNVPLAPGPLPLVFASFVPFLLDIPPTSHFTVLGYKMSDKAFIYLAGLQLLLSSGRQSLLALATSAVAGLLYRMNFCNVKKLRLPGPVARVISKFLGPWLVDPRSNGPSIIIVGNSNAAAAAAGGGFGEGFYEGVEAAVGGHGMGAGGVRHRPGGAWLAGPAAAAAAAPEPSVEALQALLAMGFTQERAVQALQQAGNDLQTAIALLVG